MTIINIDEYCKNRNIDLLEPFEAGEYWIGDPEQIAWEEKDFSWIEFVYECGFFQCRDSVYDIQGNLVFATPIESTSLMYNGYENHIDIKSRVFSLIPISLFGQLKIKTKNSGVVITFEDSFDCIHYRRKQMLSLGLYQFFDISSSVSDVFFRPEEEVPQEDYLFPLV